MHMFGPGFSEKLGTNYIIIGLVPIAMLAIDVHPPFLAVIDEMLSYTRNDS